MTEELPVKQVSFCQCLYHESKKAYSPFLKYILIGGIILGGLALIIYMWDNIVNAGTQFVQITGIIPWYVYIVTSIVTLPLVYATGVCLHKRFKAHENLIHPALVVTIPIWATMIVVGCGFYNSAAFAIGFSGIALVVGLARDV